MTAQSILYILRRMPREWKMSAPDDALVTQLSSELSINPITAKILVNRGMTTIEKAIAYLKPSLSDVPDPFLLPDMEIAVQRIIGAIEKKEKIGIFGDYDADGVTGTALLARFLRTAGSDPIIDLPDRMGEGYGLTSSAVDKFKDRGATLIITVDNGTRALKEVDYAASLGLDVIVTDHHEANGPWPKACAVVNPKREGNASQFADLSGCGVVLFLLLALKKKLADKKIPHLGEHLDLVAIGTIADVVPLTGLNRILVSHGLDQIARSRKAGIVALMDVSGTDPARLVPDSVAFQLSPRINAAGRMGSAMTALDLMLSEDAVTAFNIAKELDGANRKRQQIEGKIIEEAISMIEGSASSKNSCAIVLHSEGWHIGVIGIVAAKITERFLRPTVIISRDLKPARGSARCPSGLNLVSALSECAGLLERHGGHAMAAGLSIKEGNIDAFARRLNDVCARMMVEKTRETLLIDSIVHPRELNERLINEISRCRPFGLGNPEPVLAIANAEIVDRRILKEKHLKLKVKSEGAVFDAIGFGMANEFPAGLTKTSIAFVPELNTWNGRTSVQLKIKDIRTHV